MWRWFWEGGREKVGEEKRPQLSHNRSKNEWSEQLRGQQQERRQGSSVGGWVIASLRTFLGMFGM